MALQKLEKEETSGQWNGILIKQLRKSVLSTFERSQILYLYKVSLFVHVLYVITRGYSHVNVFRYVLPVRVGFSVVSLIKTESVFS